MSLNNLTEDEYYAYIEDHGHKLRRKKDGRVDSFFLEYAYHNGPGCVLCHKSWCHHCRDSVELCEHSYTIELFPEELKRA